MAKRLCRAGRGQSGASLMEAIMVVVFLGVAFVAVLQVMSSSLEHSVDNEVRTRAIALAEEKMEQVVGDKNGRGYGYLVNANYPVESDASGNRGFSRSVAITDYSTRKLVEVVVTHANIPPVRLVTSVTNY